MTNTPDDLTGDLERDGTELVADDPDAVVDPEDLADDADTADADETDDEA